jgi:DNA-binding beta-propeller fold protein YncE
MDHLAYDPQTQRLFVAALENGSLEVLDLAAGHRIRSVSGLPQAQGAACVPAACQIAVTSGRDGLLHVFDTRTLDEKHTVQIGPDADNVRFDPQSNTVLVSYGNTNAGAIAVLDARTWTKIRDLTFSSRPESFRLDPAGNRLFANLPRGVRAVTDGEIAVMDRETGQGRATIPLPGLARNFPMAFDAAHERLFIATRRPARLVVIDTRRCEIVAELPCTDDSDDLFYDPRSGRVLVIGGGFRQDLQTPGTASPCSPPGEMGAIDVFKVDMQGNWSRQATVPTAIHARTGLFVPERRALYLAVPMRAGRDPEIREYRLR